MKRDELNTLKEEAETENKKLHELTDEELAQVTGGYYEDCKDCPFYGHSSQCITTMTQRHCPKGHRLP